MGNQRLMKDIKTGLAEGWPLKKLRGYLVSQWYGPAEVDQALKFTAGRTEIRSERPTSVTILAVLFFISGVFSMFGLIISVVPSLFYSPTIPFLGELVGGFVVYLGILSAFIGVILSAFMGVLGFLVAWGLWNLKNWARITAIVLFVLIVLFMLSRFTIIGVLPAVLFIYILVKKSTKQAFAGGE